VIHVEGTFVPPCADNEREADGHLGGGNDEEEKHECLAIQLLPAEGCADEGEPRRVEHDFDADEDHEDVAVGDTAGGTEEEEDRRPDEHVAERDDHDPSPPAAGPPSPSSWRPR
jgi:hypothetical protein